MIGVLAPRIEAGELQVFCPDAVDIGELVQQGRSSAGAGDAASAV